MRLLAVGPYRRRSEEAIDWTASRGTPALRFHVAVRWKGDDRRIGRLHTDAPRKYCVHLVLKVHAVQVFDIEVGGWSRRCWVQLSLTRRHGILRIVVVTSSGAAARPPVAAATVRRSASIVSARRARSCQ